MPRSEFELALHSLYISLCLLSRGLLLTKLRSLIRFLQLSGS